MMNTVCGSGVADGFMMAIVIRFFIKDYSVVAVRDEKIKWIEQSQVGENAPSERPLMALNFLIKETTVSQYYLLS